MNNILELYKKHINPNPDGAEIHHFMSSFDLGLYVKHPAPKIEKFEEIQRVKDKQAAKNWIYKNSKL